MLKELEQECIRRKIPILKRKKAEWLLQKIQQLKPQRILELGTAIGYSGIILASQGAELTTIEINPKAAEESMINFKKNNITAKVLIGDGVNIIKEIKEQFDLIFIDFNLTSYNKILENCITLTKQNGFIIADNINLIVKRKTTTKHCQDFKEAILHHKKLNTEIINIEDGISISQKIS